jgi:bifunctional non-homologous end joining protein LigD
MADDIEHADRIVIDLDPGQDVEWGFVIEMALTMRDLLKTEGLKCWPKLTGSKGVHIMAPLTEPKTHDAARSYTRTLVQRLAELRPESYVVSLDPSVRTGWVFLVYLRNGRGNTAAGAWSPRVRPGFPIARPSHGAKSKTASAQMRSR